MRVLLLDNHSSHVSVKALQFALSARIRLVNLPPHTSHLLQPLDVGIFGREAHWYREAIQPLADGLLDKISKEVFLQTLVSARKKRSHRAIFMRPGDTPVSVLARRPRSWIVFRGLEMPPSQKRQQWARRRPRLPPKSEILNEF